MQKKYKGTREAFGQSLYDVVSNDPNVVLVSADSLKSARATKVAEDYPDNYIECGIAEQLSVNVAAGLTTNGLTPFVATYAGFLTMRACEQMRTFVAYPNLNVKIIGMNGGMAGGEREGCTHQFYEDVAIVSAIPNYTILLPADGPQTYHAIQMAYEIKGPVYVRIGSGREEDVYDYDTPFSETGIRVLKNEGMDILLLSSGFVLSRVMAAADILIEKGYKVTVADVNIISDNPSEELINLLKNVGKIFTFEDHNINGGVGSHIASLVSEHSPKHVYKTGLKTFAESGPASELLDKYGFVPQDIANKVCSYI